MPPKEKCPSCLFLWGPLGDTPPIRSELFSVPCKASYSRSPVKPPRGQTLRSPRPKATSVLSRPEATASELDDAKPFYNMFCSMQGFWKLLTKHRIAGWASQDTLPRSTRIGQPQSLTIPNHSAICRYVLIVMH